MSVNEYEDEYERAHSQLSHLTHVLFMREKVHVLAVLRDGGFY